MTGHKRALGWGTFFGGIVTLGVSTAAIPFYPKRCIVCGRKSTDNASTSPYSGSYRSSEYDKPPSGNATQATDTKKCPVCAETIKLEAIKCRFCGEMFDPDAVARQIAEVKKQDSFENRVLCADGTCIGVIGPDGRCNVCGRAYKPNSY